MLKIIAAAVALAALGFLTYAEPPAARERCAKQGRGGVEDLFLDCRRAD